MSAPKRLLLDTETFSELPLKKVGAYRYSEACETIIVSWAWNDAPVEVWDLSDAATRPAKLQELQRMIDAADEVVVHNSVFDRVTLAAQGVAIPVGKITDTMVLALMHSLPASLDMLCDVLNVPRDKAKDKDGKKLIQLFCKPRPKNVKLRRATGETHPDEWKAFIEYARLDVDAMRAVLHRLPRWNDTKSERELWRLDQMSGDIGVGIDLDLARSALRAFERVGRSLATAASDLTNGAVDSATQRDKLKDHLRDEYGFAMGDMKKGTVEALLKGESLPDEVRALLEVRQQASATSPAKYKVLLEATGSDSRLRGTIQFCGAARTGRSAGRLFQPQNLPRPSMPYSRIEMGIEAMKADCEDLLFNNVSELCTNAVRGALVAAEGKKLVVSDLSNIEGRVLAWLAGEEWKLQAFRDYDAGIGFDLYILAYARAFGLDPADVTKAMRQIGKVMELALGYQGAVGAFVTMAANYGVNLPEDKVIEIVKAWRAANPKIRNLWYALENAAKGAISDPGSSFVVGKLVLDYRIDDWGNPWLRMKLPSGRYLCYFNARLETHTCPKCDGAGSVLFMFEGQEKRLGCPECGDSGKVGDGRITYEGVHQLTRQWCKIDTYGGKFAEQSTQGTARDVFMGGLRRAWKAGYHLVIPVHDEAVTEVPDDPRYTEKELSSLLATQEHWNLGLPLAAAGDEMYRYHKTD